MKKEEQFYREEGIIDEVMDCFIINLEEIDDEENGEDNGRGKTEETATNELDGISILPPDSPELV